MFVEPVLVRAPERNGARLPGNGTGGRRLLQIVATSRYFAARGSTTLLRPWPGFGSSRVFTSPKDSKRDTSRLTALRSRLSVPASSETDVGLARTACSTRTRCAESTRNRSEGSSNVIVISDGSRSPRSIFRARSSDRSMNASTVPDATVTRRGIFLTTFAALFIFFSPKLSYFLVEPRGQRFIPSEFERFLPSHKVPVMVTVAIVVPEHPPVIRSAEAWVDVCKTVPDDLSFRGLPHFFFQLCATSGPLQIDRLIDDLLDGRCACPFPAQSPG